MSEDHSLTTVVSNFYGELDDNCSFKTRVNEGDQPQGILDIIKQLDNETMKRYYGSGILVPESVKGCRVLDIGCGSGSLVFILSKLVGPDGYVIGIDVCDPLLERAKSESEKVYKTWGYTKANFEFRHVNVERLLSEGMEPFDIIVSNGVFCLVPDKVKAFQAVSALLKPGGSFYLSDVYTTFEQPQKNKDDEKLWSLGTSGSMVWSDLQVVTAKEGLSTPYLMQSARVDVVNEEYKKALNYAEYVCAGWRFFKTPSGAKRGPATVTYNGNLEFYSETFPWDVSLTFKKGEPVNVDGILATDLSSSCLAKYFIIVDFPGQVTTHRNQNPFKWLADLKAAGKEPEPIYKVE